jgi:23S rRNA pseudouridine2605 synthase
MPRDSDKNNDSRGRRDRPGGSKGRSGRPRGPEKKFAKRGFAGKGDRDERPHRGRAEERPVRRRDGDEAPRPFGRDDRPPRESRDKRDFKPRGDRPDRSRDERKPRGERWGRERDHGESRNRDDARPAARFADRKFADKRPDGFRRGDDRPRKDFDRGGRRDRNSDPGDRKSDPRDRSGEKPWQKREHGRAEHRGDERPHFSRSREERPKFDRPRRDRERDPRDRERDLGDRKSDPRDRKSDPRDRGEEKPWQKREHGRAEHRGDERPRFSRSREERPKFDRPRRDSKGEPGEERRPRFEGRNDWHEHPRSDRRPDRFSDRPRRDNEDESKIFAKRPAFGGRGAYRERKDEFEFDKRASREEPRPKKSGERIAKVLARAGLASRRDAEEMVTQGRVTVNGRPINSPALDVTGNDVVALDGKPLPPRERTRLFLYHKPRGLMTTHADPEGRPTVFDNLPEGLPRLISIGRLDFNTEGLLLLTNDGGLARALELPDTGWLRRYRVRAHGEVTQAQLDELKQGIEVDGVKYGPIDATLERDQSANVWLVFAIREGKNREVRNVMAHLGLEVNRLIRISYGPFQLSELAEGEVEEVKTRVLREQLGEKVIAQAGADFTRPMPGQANDEAPDDRAPRGKKPFKPAGKSALIADRKGRRVLVQRTGSEEARARNELEANGYGPPRRPKRGYHGKRDLKPLDE